MIRLQFVCGAALSSRTIAWFSQGHFSHVDAVLPSGALLGAQDDWIGSNPPGVQIRPPAYEKWAKRMVMDVQASPTQETCFYGYLRSQIGKPYDYTAILGFIVNRNWRDDDSWFCSELIAAAGEHSRLFSHLYLAANKITPVSCALAYSAIGGKASE